MFQNRISPIELKNCIDESQGLVGKQKVEEIAKKYTSEDKEETDKRAQQLTMSSNPYHNFVDNHNHHQLALFGANKHSSSLQNNAASNKLLAHKSSFQVWKCVSFGCSLLTIALILSKWHEVSTDLYLLIGIERVMASSPSSSMSRGNETGLSWPPIPLDQLLPAPNETSFGIESMENNETMLMSHLHMSLNREHNGNNLLRQEVDAFLGESLSLSRD